MRGLGNGRVRLCLGAALATAALVTPAVTTASGSIAFGIVASPNATATNNNFLNAVACSSAGDCWAVGRYGNASGVQQTLVEHDSGSGWTLVSSPSTDATQDNILSGVTCVSPTNCWVVGSYLNAGYKTLIEHYDGNAWSIVGSPNQASATMNVLTGVACVSAIDCSAAGYWNANGGNDSTLILHWDGSAWSITPSPNPPSSTSFLNAVACSTSGGCSAVGYYYDGTALHSLIEERAAASWTIVSSPNSAADQDNLLNGVSCAGAGECWAVGDYYNGSVYRTLTEHHTSTGWHVVGSPNTASSDSNVLNAVACVTDVDCVAVGTRTTSNSVDLTLALQHTSTGWGVVGSESTTSSHNNLSGVGCVAAGACSAAGEYDGSNRLESTLIERSAAVQGADLSLKLLAATTAVVGSNVTYHLHVANGGPLDAANLHVHFSLPVGTTFVSASGGGALDANGDSVRWSLASLPAGAKTTLTVTLRMDQVKSMRASASVRSSTPDPNPANNSSSIVTKVSAS